MGVQAQTSAPDAASVPHGGLPPGATPLIPPSSEASKYQGAAVLAPSRPSGRLVVITKDGGEGTSYPIFEQLDLGRAEGDVIVPDDRYLSNRHARIAKRAPPGGETQLVLRDLGSVNGIFLRIGNAMGGDGRVEVELRDQDLFLVGQQVLKFEAVKDGEDGLGPASQHGTLLFGTPQSPRFARLLQRTVEGVARDVFHIRKVETVLGRESGDIVFTDDPFLSRRHAVVKFDRDHSRFLLADLGSSNGTFIQIHGDVGLKSGDQFRIGQQLFRVELASSRVDS
jgi:pSer/pThr/pTyr-binding forkhead associated (FHA) protein